jgi:hypothetical protein
LVPGPPIVHAANGLGPDTTTGAAKAAPEQNNKLNGTAAKKA